MMLEYILVLLFLGIKVLCATNDVSDESNFGKCTCNLHSGMCDYECCCDGDCSSQIIDKWTQANRCQNSRRYPGKVLERSDCEKLFGYVDSNLLESSLNYYSKALRILFCLEITNVKDSSNFVKKKFEATSQSQFTELLNKYGQTAVSLTLASSRTPFTSSVDRFTIGDSLNYYEKSTSTKLKWYMPDSMGMCVVTSPKFLYSDSSYSECQQYVSSASMAETTVVNAEIQSTPAGTSRIDINIDTSTLSTSKTVTLIQANELNITYSSSINQITAATNKQVRNSYNIGDYAYRKNSLRFAVANEAYRRSGNPGYQKGMPLRMGYYVNSIFSEIYDLAIIGAGSTGECLYISAMTEAQITENYDNKIDYNQKLYPKFGYSGELACYTTLTYPQFQSYCQGGGDLKLKFANILNSSSRIGYYGNANKNDLEDWRTLTISERTAPIFSSSDQTCKMYFPNLVIIGSRMGAQESPQYYISYAALEYKEETWSFTSIYQKQKFLSKFYVTYIDEPNQSLKQYREAPNIIPKLPRNALYPFKVDESQN